MVASTEQRSDTSLVGLPVLAPLYLIVSFSKAARWHLSQISCPAVPTCYVVRSTRCDRTTQIASGRLGRSTNISVSCTVSVDTTTGAQLWAFELPRLHLFVSIFYAPNWRHNFCCRPRWHPQRHPRLWE